MVRTIGSCDIGRPCPPTLETLEAAVDADLASIGESVAGFVCPVIPVPGR